MNTNDKLAVLDREIARSKTLQTQIAEEMEVWRKELEFCKRIESVVTDALVAAEAATNRLTDLRSDVVAGKV